MKEIQLKFPIGSQVLVSPEDDDIFEHEFIGHVIGYKHHAGLIQVADQGNNVYDVGDFQLHNLD